MPIHDGTLKNVKEAMKILSSLQPKIDKLNEIKRIQRERIIKNKTRKEKLEKLKSI